MSCCLKLEKEVAAELDSPQLSDILRAAADHVRNEAAKIGITIGPEVEQHLIDFAVAKGHLLAEKLRDAEKHVKGV